MGTPVDMRAESHALFVELAQLRQRHDLETAGIRQDRPRPAGKIVQSAEFCNPFSARAQHQVIGVAENDIGAKLGNLIHIHGLDRARRADRHEGGRADSAARHGDFTAPGLAIGCDQFEFKIFCHDADRHNRLASP